MNLDFSRVPMHVMANYGVLSFLRKIADANEPAVFGTIMESLNRQRRVLPDEPPLGPNDEIIAKIGPDETNETIQNGGAE